MAKVYNFPQKKVLSDELKDRLYELAKDYVVTLNDVANELCDDPWDADEMYEAMELATCAYLEGVEIAIDELE